ncbi:MAG: glycolate oxidase iron-sulfur subunit [Acidobacteriota bacterium]|jgi:glycolate oxidase iron-sulfur subunit|nr:glycolate oxidase iron-sulfur subunit [Acidobacteriota bacterium]
MNEYSSTQLASALKTEERKLLACVHCGLCLEACPTYVQTGDENDSPRGRLYLMRAVEEGRLSLESNSFTRHIDRCLGCRACESACPAGVEYGQLLEAARADIADGGRRRGWTSRLMRLVLRHVWQNPARLRFAFALSRLLRDSRLPHLLLKSKATRLLPTQMELALALLDSSRASSFGAKLSGTSSFVTESRPPQTLSNQSSALSNQPSPALLFEGCVTEGLFARVNRATVRVLRANGCSTVAPRGQVCCGALHAHAGDMEGARELARRNLDAFEDSTGAPVITNAGGCGAMLASYAHLLAHDDAYAARAVAFSARVRDVSQQLAAKGFRRVGARLDDMTATYDASCHLLHGQKAQVEPLRMLGQIEGLRLVPLEGSDVCCGGAGVYNLLEMELSSRVLEEKLGHIRETGASVLATGNPGCHMQLGAGARLSGLSLRVVHPVELLDESYRRAGLYAGEGS